MTYNNIALQAIRSIFNAACGPGRPMPTEADLPAPGDSETMAANRMELFWIRSLHKAFESFYSGRPEVVVLSKAKFDAEWHRNEFLHDVTVVERFKVKSAYHERELPVARRIFWQVESELSGDGREVAIDFSKLVAGSAENKLLVVRRPMEHQIGGQTKIKRFVKDMAFGCGGNLFLAFVPSYASTHKHLETYWKPNQPLPFDLFFRDISTNDMMPVLE